MAGRVLVACWACVFLAWSTRLASASVPIGATVGWQAHSYDDMREWQQLLIKGARYLKIDPHWMPQAFCKTQGGVANASDPRGCMVLSHDNPTPERTDYNTTDQLPAALADPALKPYLTTSHTFFISLCFKSAPDYCNATSSTFAGWRSLVSDLYQAIRATVNATGVNVKIILDGDGAPKDCLVNAWRPWPSTYITGDDPSAAFKSNNATLGYDRFAVLNEPVEWFPVAAALKYGKFVNESMTFLLWEPSDQFTIDLMLDTYLGVGIAHQPGLRFAINIDPAMFQVYAASKTGTAWNVPFASTGVAVTSVLFDNGVSSLFAVSDGSGGQLAYSTTTFSTFLGSFTTPSAPKSVASPLSMAGRKHATALNSPQGSYVVIDNGANVIGATVNPVNPVLDAPSVAFTVPNAKPGDAVAPVYVGQTDMYFIAVTAASGTSTGAGAVATCGLYATLYRVALSPLAAPTPVGTPACLQAGVVVANASASFVSVGGTEVTGVVVYASKSGGVFGATVCVPDLLTGHMVVNAPCSSSAASVLREEASPPAAHQFHVGSNPSVGVGLSTDGRVYVVEAHGDGFCPNSETHNKQPTPGVCGQVPTSTPQVLNYAIGPLDAFRDMLRSGSMVSACSHTILHGAYGRGSHPHVSVFANPAGGSGTDGNLPVLFPNDLAFAIAADDMPSGTAPVGCGSPLSGNGTHVAAWQPQYTFPGFA